MPDKKIICFQQDTKERKRFFKAASFAHPAKMVLGLQIYLIEHYTKPGDVILDPMAGSGTILIACTLGRNVVLIELEDKFVKMQQDNYQKIKSLGPMLGYQMGKAIILQGDARNLDGLLADNILFSPPYAEAHNQKGLGVGDNDRSDLRDYSYLKTETKGQIGNLPYGEISAVISSPPYAETQEGGGIAKKGYQGSKHSPTDLIGKRSYMPSQIGKSDGQISNLKYGDVDAVITSPPYEGSVTGENGINWSKLKGKNGNFRNRTKEPAFDRYAMDNFAYSNQQDNIGNLKSENYLEAMLQVYQQCHRVLKPKGLMVLVVKNFIRDKKIVRLDLDTVKICEKAGFKLIETLKRKLTQQSFWRTIYHHKYPDVEKIEYEDVLIFQRADA